MKQETTTKTSYHIPVGPIHPALKEPVHFEFELDGEKIVGVDVKLGHVHRAVEWASRKRNPIQMAKVWRVTVILVITLNFSFFTFIFC